MFGKELFIQLMCVSFVSVGQICVYPSFPFDIEGGMRDVIVLTHDHCVSIYFT